MTINTVLLFWCAVGLYVYRSFVRATGDRALAGFAAECSARRVARFPRKIDSGSLERGSGGVGGRRKKETVKTHDGKTARERFVLLVSVGHARISSNFGHDRRENCDLVVDVTIAVVAQR